jgi:hypothetical protein
MEVIEAGKHDDASFLLELHQSIKRHAFRERAEGSVFLPRCLNHLKRSSVDPFPN